MRAALFLLLTRRKTLMYNKLPRYIAPLEFFGIFGRFAAFQNSGARVFSGGVKWSGHISLKRGSAPRSTAFAKEWLPETVERFLLVAGLRAERSCRRDDTASGYIFLRAGLPPYGCLRGVLC